MRTSQVADLTGSIPPTVAAFGDTDTSQRTSNVALGRSPRFNAAIFGNSHGQLLSPQRLSRATGLNFVQLTVPGSNVREQLAMMHWFIAHHADIGAMVLALDERWCVTDPALPVRTPFPFWLYSDSNLVYLANAMSTRSLRDSIRRVAAAFGSPPSGRSRRLCRLRDGKGLELQAGPAGDRGRVSGRGRAIRPRFPGADPARCRARRNPGGNAGGDRDAAAVLHAAAAAGTPAAQFRDTCKERIAARAQRGARGGAFIDFLVDSEITRSA